MYDQKLALFFGHLIFYIRTHCERYYKRTGPSEDECQLLSADQVFMVKLHSGTLGPVIMFSCTSGGSGSGRGTDKLPDIMSEDEVFEYLLEEVASYERNDHVSPSNTTYDIGMDSFAVGWPYHRLP